MTKTFAFRFSLLAATAAALPVTLHAQAGQPEDLLPQRAQIEGEAVDVEDDAVATDSVERQLDAIAEKKDPAVQVWSVASAQELLSIVEGMGAEGLKPADYEPAKLRAAIAAGQGDELNMVASRTFAWVVEDLRDGRTPMTARKQWFVFDPDQDRYPTARLMAQALEGGSIDAALQRIMPEHPDYAALRDALGSATTPARRKLIQANMDRWRWLPRDLGSQYLITNVPEYQLRLTVNDTIVRTYKTVVGKPGRTATPQLAESIEGVVFNPTWTVPQSIVQGEGLGAKVLNNPTWAKNNGYAATRGENGWVTVVQQPGPDNSLGLMKLHMPNRHAIFFHDTPSKHYFNSANRALSHGCIRTERASELAMTLAILRAGKTADEAAAIQKTGEYTLVPFKQQMPAYITYFTMAKDIEGKLRTFNDIYGRDAAVLESFEKARVANRSRVTDEQVIPIENDPRDTA
ncbi:L,D-transpeptidase family protein [Qipengyuania sp. JC766]|uniref:L,D-transpeptidase family protein n=1 Tax=Qipengyuania sp. JC766 TaxID=3232139 RepID=UPI003459A047